MAAPSELRGLAGSQDAAVAIVGASAPQPARSDDTADGDTEVVVHYYFPVEIEVRAATDDVDPTVAARLALEWLTEGLRAV